MSVAEQNQAPQGPKVVRVAGRELLVAPLTTTDSLLVRNFVKAKARSLVQEVAAAVAGLAIGLQEVAIKEAVARQAASDGYGPQAAAEALLTPDGCRLLLYLHARHHQPQTPRSELDALVTADNFVEVYSAIAGAGV